MKRMVLIPEEKLLQYEQQQKSDVLHDVPNKQYGWGEKKEKEEKRELSDDIIVRGIPKTMRTRAIALLERLKARPDVISWDDMGQVKIDGVFIPKSNISDLISSAMRSRKYFDPVASQEFFNVLNNINVPKDLVRNEEGWKKITQKGKGEDHDVFVKTMGDFGNEFTKSLGGFASLYGGGRGKRKKLTTLGQKGGFGGNQRLLPLPFTPVIPYLDGWHNIEKKRKASQKGRGKLRKIPNWECYKG